MDAKLIRVSAKGAVRLAVPNLNVDRRPLPSSVPLDLTDPSKVVVLDKDKPFRRPTDPQLYQLQIEVTAAELAAHPSLSAVVTGLDPLFVLLDSSGRPVSSTTLDLAAEFAKSTKTTPNVLIFFIEAETFSVSPLIPDSIPDFKVDFRENGQSLSSTSLPLFASDLILMGDNESAVRLYIADIDDNQPTLTEVKAAASSAGVPVVTVPGAVCNGDTWIQDQFQFAITFDDTNTLQNVAVHLPRMRSNSQIVSSSDNLGGFVDNHFPSQNVGVFKDFWNSQIPVPGVTSSGPVTLQLKVKDSNAVLNQLMPVTRVWAQIANAIRQMKGSATPPTLPAPFFTKRSQLVTQLNVLKSTPANSPEQKRDKDLLTAALDLKLLDINKNTPLVSAAVRLTITGQTIDVAEKDLNDLFDRLSDIHSSTNYGGNIEVSPPTSGGPFGKVITGDIASKDLQKTLDRIAAQSAAQPSISIGTNWLSVGHIDEIASFIVPSGSATGSPAVLRASPKLALVLLEAAKAAQDKDVLVTRLFRGKQWRHEEDRSTTDPLLPPTAYQFLINGFGKYDVSEFRNPPTVIPLGPSAFFDDRKYLFFLSGNSSARDYAAHMSVTEVLEICRETNRTIDDVFLGGNARGARLPDYPLLKGLSQDSFTDILKRSLDAVVVQEFSGASLIPLPVLFDRVSLFVESSTEAFTPGLVNLQQLGRTVLVPRPYGPRMRPDGAISLLTGILADSSTTGLSSSLLQTVKKSLTQASLHRRQLDITTHWTRPTRSCLCWDPAALNRKGFSDTVETLDVVAEIFRDGFDEFVNPERDYTKNDTFLHQTARDDFNTNIPKIKQRINQANPGAFDSKGYVNGNGWRRIVIPENTVDLFEVYTQLVLEAIGLTVKWVDSWFYHVHAGGVHCATNVLRSISPAEVARRAASYKNQ